MYKNILVPHPGTEMGDIALEYAMPIAKCFNSKLTLLHVVNDDFEPPTFGLEEEDKENIHDTLRSANISARDSMRLFLEKKLVSCKKQNIDATVEVLLGSPTDEITNFVVANAIDLVVIPKRKKLRGFKKLLKVGSVSRNIVEHVTCPVLMLDGEQVQQSND